ncbi:MAG: CYTH domain-containing protein [Magnetococcales bacterium]|nr:CYTH domain-containing protein [Magnetococcales bacterium]
MEDSPDSAVVEEEIRLTVPDSTTFAALGRELLARGGGSGFLDRSYTDLYLDHPDRLLLQSRLALRHRATAGTTHLEIKGEGVLDGGVWHRPEWRQGADAVPPAQVGEMADGPVRRRLEMRLGMEAPLAPLLTCTIERRVMVLIGADGARLEVSLDRGEIRAGGRRVRIAELEIECGSGARGAGMALARGLRERFALREAPHSKFRIGLALLAASA